jgi:hypothetical protein
MRGPEEQATTTIESKVILLGPPPNPFLSTNFQRTVGKAFPYQNLEYCIPSLVLPG